MVYEKFGVHLEGDKAWLPSGERVDVDTKMRYFLAPTMEKIYYLDEVVHEFYDRGRMFTVPNNQSFAESLLKHNIDIPRKS
jgi:hypothetical protein